MHSRTGLSLALTASNLNSNLQTSTKRVQRVFVTDLHVTRGPWHVYSKVDLDDELGTAPLA